MEDWQIRTGQAGIAMESLKATVVLSMLPSLERFVTWAGAAATEVRELLEGTKLLEAAAIVLGGVLVGVAVATAPAWAPMAVTILGVAAAIGVAVLAVDDLLVTIDGGDSILRRWIDGMLGVGATTRIIDNARQAWVDLKMVLEELANNAMVQRMIGALTLRPIRQAIGSLARGDIGGAARDVIGRELVVGGGRALDAARQGDITGAFSRLSGTLFGGRTVAAQRRERSLISRERERMSARNRRQSERIREEDAIIRSALGEGAPGGGQTFMPEPANQTFLPASVSGGSSRVEQNTTINVNGAGDPRAVGEEVMRRVREENDRQTRQLEAALVPAAP
jgi:hypothetical protein